MSIYLQMIKLIDPHYTVQKQEICVLNETVLHEKMKLIPNKRLL